MVVRWVETDDLLRGGYVESGDESALRSVDTKSESVLMMNERTLIPTLWESEQEIPPRLLPYPGDL